MLAKGTQASPAHGVLWLRKEGGGIVCHPRCEYKSQGTEESLELNGSCKN